MLKYLCMNILQHENELKQYMFCSLAINSEEDIQCLIRLLEYSKIWNVAVSYMSGFLFLSWKQKIMVFSKVCSPRSLREDWEKQNQQIHQANKGRRLKSHWMVSQVLFSPFWSLAGSQFCILWDRSACCLMRNSSHSRLAFIL